MEIKLVASDKKEFLDLLLLADEQESMIDRYLERGDMFVLYDNGLKALCVVTREGEGNQEYCYRSFLSTAGVRKTFNRILI